MCGRFTLHHSVEEVAERFGAADILYADAPRYNIAPSQAVAAVVADNVSARRLVSLKWGLVPSWANDPTIGNRLLNAKGETLAEKPSFKQALVNRRCLIPADGFYEWRKSPGGSQPFHIRRRDGGLFAFAGLWEEWQSPGSAPLRTCTLITVEPNELMLPIHHRMPAILTLADEERWLDPARKTAADLTRLLRPYPDDDFEAYPVSRAVNAPTHNDPKFIEACESPA